MQNPSDDLFADDPTEQESNDKRCAHRDEATGKPCRAWHIKDSPFCNVHAGGLAKMNENRSRNVQRQKELQEDLQCNLQELNSIEDVRSALQKIYNALLFDFIKKDKANTLVFILQQVQKTLEKEKPGPRNFLNIQIGGAAEAARITAALSGADLDQFLLAGEHASVQMLEDLQKQGRVKVEKKGEAIIEEQIVDVTPEPDAEAAAELLGTDTEEVIDLFALHQSHDWIEKATPVEGATYAVLSYTCSRCGKTSKAKTKKDHCDG